jgi:hypothetical protein
MRQGHLFFLAKNFNNNFASNGRLENNNEIFSLLFVRQLPTFGHTVTIFHGSESSGKIFSHCL